MKPYHLNDFRENDAWLIFRVDTQVEDQPVDIYMVMDLPSGMILTLDTIITELSQAKANKLLKEARAKKGKLPHRIILAKGDPAESVLRKSAESLAVTFDAIPSAYLEELTAPLKESFGQHFYSPSSMGYANTKDNLDESEKENVKKMIPDSYDPCSCASGKKYKFCCKKIFCEIVESMVAAENGQLSEALKWINQAKAIAGETSEVLCREAIIYSYFDLQKSEDFLNKCLLVNPKHPRAHYIRGIMLKEQGDNIGAIKSYKTAITNYPPSDHYHLNETYNNLGTAFYAIGDLVQAKSAWEKALLYLPSDKMVQKNLSDFIYNNQRG